MIDKAVMEEINAFYNRLDVKCVEIYHALFHRVFELEYGWYNGHYHKDDMNEWVRESYPIPVISVKGFCDIEIQSDKISVSTKLSRYDALNYSFDKFVNYEFESYGVDDYLADYYHSGQTVLQMKENIRACNEKEIGFSFYFPFDIDVAEIYEFVKLLRCEGFYY